MSTHICVIVSSGVEMRGATSCAACLPYSYHKQLGLMSKANQHPQVHGTHIVESTYLLHELPSYREGGQGGGGNVAHARVDGGLLCDGTGVTGSYFHKRGPPAPPVAMDAYAPCLCHHFLAPNASYMTARGDCSQACSDSMEGRPWGGSRFTTLLCGETRRTLCSPSFKMKT